jgi:hypothetical protein
MGLTILIRGKWKRRSKEVDAVKLARDYGLDEKRVYDEINKPGAESKDGSVRIGDFAGCLKDPKSAGAEED